MQLWNASLFTSLTNYFDDLYLYSDDALDDISIVENVETVAMVAMPSRESRPLQNDVLAIQIEFGDESNASASILVIDSADCASEAIEGIEGNTDTLHYFTSACNYNLLIFICR